MEDAENPSCSLQRAPSMARRRSVTTSSSSAKKIMVPNSTYISVVDTILRHDAPASLLFAMDLTYLSCWESEQLLQKDVNLLNPMAELEKHSQEEASRAVHQLIIVEDFKEFLDDVMSGDGPWGEEEVLSHWPLLARPADPEIAPPHENVRVSSAAAPFRPRAPIPSLPPPSIYSAVPVLDLRSPNPDEIGRFHPISRQTQPQLLVGHAGSTDELLIDVHPAAPPTTVPSLLDSAPPTCRTIGLSSILARVKLATVKMQNSCNSILLQLSGAEGVRSNSAGGQTGSALGHATINAR
ncbi:uncharacterized protein [Triticum aestivum]|uniref:uncharacterized protein isoform X5 n=1 Tax=Triticum aestivum TaxID=4565 RepID=UPI001D007F41|nr:uncharacterized protein LOC123044952 isoform X5 [Triticum aestivum]